MKRLVLILLVLTSFAQPAGENDCGSLEKCDAFSSDVHRIRTLQDLR